MAPEPLQKEPAKFAEKLLDLADSKAKAGAKILIGAAGALLLLWHATLEPLVPKLNVLWSQVSTAQRDKKDFEAYRRKVIEVRAAEPASSQALPARATPVQQAKVDRLKQASDDSLKLKRAAEADAKVAFSIPNLPSFTVPTRLAGLTWQAILLLSTAYFLLIRLQLHGLSARAARCLQEADPASFPYRPPNTFQLPWWCAPLPNRNGQVVSAPGLRTFAGKEAWEPASNWMVLGILMCSFVLQVRVAMISMAATATFGNQRLLSDLDLLALLAAGLMPLATLCIGVVWFAQRPVPDAPAAPAPHLPRRIAVVGAACLALGTVTAVARGRIRPNTIVSWLRSPRFRRGSRGIVKGTTLNAGLYLNKRSRKLHVVQPIGHTAGKRVDASSGNNRLAGIRTAARRAPDPKNFEAVPVGTSDGQRWDFLPLLEAPWNRRGQLVESLAHQLVGAARIDEAAQLLLGAVRADLVDLKRGLRREPDWRIYYLAARTLLLHAGQSRFDQLLEAVSSLGDASLFENAVRSWTRTEGRWRRRLHYFKQ